MGVIRFVIMFSNFYQLFFCFFVSSIISNNMFFFVFILKSTPKHTPLKYRCLVEISNRFVSTCGTNLYEDYLSHNRVAHKVFQRGSTQGCFYEELDEGYGVKLAWARHPSLWVRAPTTITWGENTIHLYYSMYIFFFKKIDPSINVRGPGLL